MEEHRTGYVHSCWLVSRVFFVKESTIKGLCTYVGTLLIARWPLRGERGKTIHQMQA